MNQIKTVVAIDPGCSHSAFVQYEIANGIISKGKMENSEMKSATSRVQPDLLIIEMIASYGMPVGKEVFDTCLFIGQMQQLVGMKRTKLVYRKDIKMHLCGSMKAKDSNIRQALIDRWGAPGTKKQPGATYGISSDVWSALAVLTYWKDTVECLDQAIEVVTSSG